MKKKIAILGSTGSIGKTLIDILKKDKKSFKILLLSTNKNLTLLLKQVKIFNVKNIIVTDNKTYLIAKKKLNRSKTSVYNNFDNFNKIFKSSKSDYTMNSITGLNGLKPTLNIIRYSKKIAIANKESIICGWSLILRKLKRNKTEFIPIDSEHFSIWSLLNNAEDKNVEKIYITASGGPFLNYPLKKFKFITPKYALKHPNWKMGKKITIDSSTMMNKVFEIIEARKIFNIPYEKLNIAVHPKSYVHAMIKFKNGLTKMLIHDTNMTVPIFNSLYPKYQKNIKSQKINFKVINNLNFKKVDLKRFPIVKIIETLPLQDSLFETVIVSANDQLVKLFLEKKIKFIDISKILLKIINLAEFKKYKDKAPKNINEIENLNNYVSLKTNLIGV
tara:strand:- start:387 stop:1553 length:1167 start_codon:yes stop_codon:yes gene_type:complete